MDSSQGVLSSAKAQAIWQQQENEHSGQYVPAAGDNTNWVIFPSTKVHNYNSFLGQEYHNERLPPYAGGQHSSFSYYDV